MHVQHEIQIERPPDIVFAFLADPANAPRWQQGMHEARLATPGPMRQGSRLVEVRELLGRRHETTLEVTAFEPGSRFDLCALDGPLGIRVRQRLEASGAGTRLSVEVDARPGGLLRFAGGMLRPAIEGQVRGDLESLRRVLEAEA